MECYELFMMENNNGFVDPYVNRRRGESVYEYRTMHRRNKAEVQKSAQIGKMTLNGKIIC